MADANIRRGTQALQDPHLHHLLRAPLGEIVGRGAAGVYKIRWQKQNKTVQMAARSRYRGTKVYNKRMPQDVQYYLVYLGNKPNELVTKTTYLEQFKATVALDQSWLARMNKMQWTSSSLSQTELEKLKFLFICACFNYWPTYNVSLLSQVEFLHDAYSMHTICLNIVNF